MKLLHLLPTLLLALPLAATAQTAKPATRQVSEVTEDLDPATGKVIRRTTRTYSEPVGTTTTAPAATKTAVPAGTSTTTTSSSSTTTTPSASDAVVSDFLREKIVVSRLDAAGLLSAYSQFMDKVRNDRAGWNTANWDTAASVMSSLNARYEQLRAGSGFSTDDKVTIRSQQVEFQALRTARRVTEQITDKL